MENIEVFEMVEVLKSKKIKRIKISKKGKWNNFILNDQIVYEDPNGEDSVRYTVDGFGIEEGGIFAYPTANPKLKHVPITDPNGLVLLRRYNNDFYVTTTRVIGISGKVVDEVGTILALNPKRYNEPEYIVKFEHDFEDGHDCRILWDKPWYPRKHKVKDAKNLYLCLTHQIKFLQ